MLHSPTLFLFNQACYFVAIKYNGKEEKDKKPT